MFEALGVCPLVSSSSLLPSAPALSTFSPTMSQQEQTEGQVSADASDDSHIQHSMVEDVEHQIWSTGHACGGAWMPGFSEPLPLLVSKLPGSGMESSEALASEEGEPLLTKVT
jgi:hypothetical protein